MTAILHRLRCCILKKLSVAAVAVPHVQSEIERHSHWFFAQFINHGTVIVYNVHDRPFFITQRNTSRDKKIVKNYLDFNRTFMESYVNVISST